MKNLVPQQVSVTSYMCVHAVSPSIAILISFSVIAVGELYVLLSHCKASEQAPGKVVNGNATIS